MQHSPTGVNVGGTLFSLGPDSMVHSARLARDAAQAAGEVLLYDRDPDIFSLICSTLRYGTVRAIFGEAGELAQAFARLGGSGANMQQGSAARLAGALDGAPQANSFRMTDDVLFRLMADLVFFEVSADGVPELVETWQAARTPEYGRAMVQLRDAFRIEDPRIAIERAVRYYTLGGSAEFSLKDVANGKRRVLNLSRTKLRVQEPMGRAIVKSVYGKEVSVSLLDAEPLRLSLALAHGKRFTFECASEELTLVVAHTLRGFNEKYQSYVKLDS